MKRYIPLKNYFLAALTIILVVSLSFYFYRWYKVYEEEQTRECYLTKTNTITMEITKINDINTILTEAPSDYFIYVSYTRDKKVLDLERKLKKVIDKYGLNDSIYYINATKSRRNNDYLNKINRALNINLTKLPAIIYIKDNNIDESNIIESKDKIFSVEDFENLLKKNSIEKLSQ